MSERSFRTLLPNAPSERSFRTLLPIAMSERSFRTLLPIAMSERGLRGAATTSAPESVLLPRIYELTLAWLPKASADCCPPVNHFVYLKVVLS